MTLRTKARTRAVIAVCSVIIGLLVALSRWEETRVNVYAHADTGDRLPVLWHWANQHRNARNQGDRILRIIVRNTYSSKTTAQATARMSDGSEQFSNPVHTVIQHPARNVCLHIEARGRGLVQIAAQPHDGTWRFSKHGDETVILLGDMTPAEARTLLVGISGDR